MITRVVASFLMTSLFAGLASMEAAPIQPESLVLWYKTPAGQWGDALPLGNGRLGAMVFGGTAKERIGLNEDTLWSGGPYEPSSQVDQATRDEIKRLMFAGDFGAAQKLDEKLQGRPNSQASYQTIGELCLDFPGLQIADDYRRQLDLDTAIATVTYRVGTVNYRREVFVSPVDQVVVVHITADHPGSISFSATYDSPLETKVATNGAYLRITGKNGNLVDRHTNKVVIPAALTFESRTRVVADGGRLASSPHAITVQDANSVTLLVASATSFNRYDDVSGDPAARVTATLAAIAGKPYAALKADHIAEHQRLFGRVRFDLGRTPAADLPTDERIRGYSKESDPALVALHFQFGRYLLLSSSRPGGQPANLQGLWNDKLMAPWGGKYTVNINTEMNYWPAQVTNLSETEEPLFSMIEDIAQGAGAKTARRTYGADGWVLHHNTDLWRPAAPIDRASWGQWQTGGAWLSVQLYDTYRFTGDKTYLQKLYPILKGCARFFLDTLVEEPEHHWLVTLPSCSPEHEFTRGVTNTYGPTMDMQILRDLFTACIDASEALGTDAGLRKTWTDARARLAPNQIGSHGQLQEWIKDWDYQAPDPSHRHMSPLYGVYPGFDITPADTKVFAAARVLAERRAIGGMGWANAWRICIWARLLEAEKAGEFVDLMLSKWTESNLFDKPSTQLDGNFGFTAGVAEMLLQSQDDEVDLMPAWPMDKWPRGAITGLRARGGFEVGITWKDGHLVSTTIRSLLGNPLRLRFGAHLVDTPTTAGQVLSFDANLNRLQ